MLGTSGLKGRGMNLHKEVIDGNLEESDLEQSV